MISRLRSKRASSRYVASHYSSKGNWVNAKYAQGKRAWTDKQIQEAMGVTEAEFKSILKEVTPRQWMRPQVDRLLTAFVKKHERWPTTGDLRAKHLPYTRTVNRLYAGDPWGESRRGLDTWIREYAEKNIKNLTPALVLGIVNVTDRRDIITKYGMEKVIRGGGGKIIQQDDFGILWGLELGDDVEAGGEAVYVEVVNSSPRLNKKGEPIKRNGSYVYDHYFLRVPPGIGTAQNAVAWTFDIDREQFEGFVAQS